MTIKSLLEIFCPFIRQAYSNLKTVIVSDCDFNPDLCIQFGFH